MSKPPSRSLTLLSFWAPFLEVTCAESAPASQAFNFHGGGPDRSQLRTYPLILSLEGKVLDDYLITFPWSFLGGSSCMVKITPNAPNLDHAKK